jgi:hypothetical protein
MRNAHGRISSVRRMLTVVSILLLMTIPGLAEETEESPPVWQGSLGLSLVATSGNSDTQVDLEARPETPFVARLERWCHMCGMT